MHSGIKEMCKQHEAKREASALMARKQIYYVE
jgi:hypothetical protein